MSTPKKTILFTLGGYLFFLITLFYQVYWILLFPRYLTHGERLSQFKRLLPVFCKDPRAATGFFIVFCVVAIVLLMLDFRRKGWMIKTLSIIPVVLSGLLILLLLFSLM
jgi:hypothetical protein